MKKVILMAVFYAITSTQANAEKIVTAYACECSSSKKACDGLENLKFKLIKNGNGQIMIADVGSEDWEFNDGFKSMGFSRRLPERLAQEFTAYRVIEGKSHIPGAYSEADLIIKKNMVPSDLKLSAKTGEAQLINSKNRITMKFTCDKISPKNF